MTDNIVIPDSKSFATLEEAYQWGCDLIRKGVKVQQSRLRDNYFNSFRPRDKMFRLLGVQRNVDKICKRIEPNGVWQLEVTHNTSGMYQFSIWYNRFLPYAVAMLNAENHFPNATGIDFESINTHYGTCMGFVSLGDGDYDTEQYQRIVREDTSLFRKCYHSAMAVRTPHFPFDEALYPCMVYVALHKPKLVTKMVDRGHGWFKIIADTCRHMGVDVPKEIQRAI